VTDLLFRGRGANVGVRAPGPLIRLAGAALMLGIYVLADSLGLWTVLGMRSWYVQLLLMLLGGVLATTRAGSLLWLVLGLLATTYCVVLFTPLVRPAALAFVRTDAESAFGELDAVVVLSGWMTDEGRLAGAALDRLLSGIAEAKRRGVPSLALSIVEERSGSAPISSEADQRALTGLIAPELDVRFVRDVHSTRDEALAFAALARTHQWRRVLLVTSPMHSRRACAAVEAAGLKVQCRPSDARDFAMSRLDRAENRRHAFADVLYESAATLLYRARHWVR
jgi:uncharacterized SAM-binding protein YcdF (DUF218 family)